MSERDEIIGTLEGLGGALRAFGQKLEKEKKGLKAATKALAIYETDLRQARDRAKVLKKAKVVTLEEWALIKNRIPSLVDNVNFLTQKVATYNKVISDLTNEIAQLKAQEQPLMDELKSLGQLIHLEAYRNGRV